MKEIVKHVVGKAEERTEKTKFQKTGRKCVGKKKVFSLVKGISDQER